MVQADGRIIPVILSGGAGAGLWPMSRESYPKQLLSLLGQHTLVQRTALRVADPLLFAGPMVIANAEQRFELGAQLQSAGVTELLVCRGAIAGAARDLDFPRLEESAFQAQSGTYLDEDDIVRVQDVYRRA